MQNPIAIIFWQKCYAESKKSDGFPTSPI